ncbi:MAG: hypothetical protein WBP25_12735 [Giesbergeria sp.]|jgi:hypothetical protein
MRDKYSWVQQKAALAKESGASEFVKSVTADLEQYDSDSQGDALLALASALRVDLVPELQPNADENLLQIIFGLLDAAEEKLPNDPLPPMLQATLFFYDCRDPIHAYPHALRAVEKARQSQDMVRQTTGELIRIHIALDNYQAVEPLLTFLLDYQPGAFSMEIPLELDFLASLPINSVNSSIIDAYRAKVGLS